jgi:hypothetical protein
MARVGPGPLTREKASHHLIGIFRLILTLFIPLYLYTLYTSHAFYALYTLYASYTLFYIFLFTSSCLLSKNTG